MLTRIKPGLALWQSMHIHDWAANAGGYEDPTQQQQWAQADSGDYQGDSSESEPSWQPEAGGSQEWPAEQEAVETQAWQQAPEDLVEWAKEAEQLSAQNGEALEKQERKESAEWVEPAELSRSAGQDGSIAEAAANPQRAPEWVERSADFKEPASGDSEWSADSIWKESAQEGPAESSPETSAGDSWQSEQADAWQQDTLDINPSEPAGEYATPEAEWASPAGASSDEAQLWQVNIPPTLLRHLLQPQQICRFAALYQLARACFPFSLLHLSPLQLAHPRADLLSTTCHTPAGRSAVGAATRGLSNPGRDRQRGHRGLVCGRSCI